MFAFVYQNLPRNCPIWAFACSAHSMMDSLLPTKCKRVRMFYGAKELRIFQCAGLTCMCFSIPAPRGLRLNPTMLLKPVSSLSFHSGFGPLPMLPRTGTGDTFHTEYRISLLLPRNTREACGNHHLPLAIYCTPRYRERIFD